MNRVRARRKPQFFQFIFIAALANLFVIAGCGGSTAAKATTPAPTATDAPTATSVPLANAHYASTTGTFAIDYPGTWTIQPINDSNTPGAVAFSPADSSGALSVSPLTTLVPTSQYAQAANNFLASSKATGIMLDASTSTTTLPSGTWTTLKGTMTISAIPYTFAMLGSDHGDVTYLIYTLAPTSTATSNATIYFKPMLDSFKFLK